MPTLYDEIADLFMASLAGQLSGVTREMFIERMKATYPTEEGLRKFYDSLQQQAQAMVAQVERQAAANGSRVVGVAYPIPNERH